jgi:hypothetical protein
MNSEKAEPLLKRRRLLAALCTFGTAGAAMLQSEDNTAYAATQKGTAQKGAAQEKKAAWMQDNWRWCNKCQGLFFAGHGAGACPLGGGHDSTGSGDYGLTNYS